MNMTYRSTHYYSKAKQQAYKPRYLEPSVLIGIAGIWQMAMNLLKFRLIQYWRYHAPIFGIIAVR